MTAKRAHEEVGIEFKELVEDQDPVAARFAIHYRDGTSFNAEVELGETAWYTASEGKRIDS